MGMLRLLLISASLLLLAKPTFADPIAYKPSRQARVVIDDGALQGALSSASPTPSRRSAHCAGSRPHPTAIGRVRASP
jgi:hypothetical protein